MKDYAILRILMKGATESHSIEYKDTLKEAETRWHNILAADEGNAQTTFCMCVIFDRNTNQARIEVRDWREEKTAFYILLRIFEKNEEMAYSVQYYNDDPQNPGQAFKNAEARWYGVIAADLDDAEKVYNAAVMMDNSGSMGEYHKAFTKPVPDVEPEGETGETGETGE